MANIYYGVSRGEVKVTVSASTTSKNVELVVLQGNINSQTPIRKAEIIEALELIEAAVREDKTMAQI